MVLKISGLVEEMREGLKESTYPRFQLYPHHYCGGWRLNKEDGGQGPSLTGLQLAVKIKTSREIVTSLKQHILCSISISQTIH